MSDLSAAGSGIREVRIERERFPDGSVEKDYRLIIVDENGTQIVIEMVTLAGLLELAWTVREYVKPTGAWLD